MRNGSEPGTAPRYPLSSVDNVLRMLDLFRAGRPVRVSEAATALGLARSTAHRLLATLESRGFVRHERSTRAYIVGEALVSLGRAVVRERALEHLARDPLRALVDEIGETAHVAILQGPDVHFIACVESPHTLRTGSHVGSAFPAHATACGKVLLAALDDDALRELFAREPIGPFRRAAVKTWSDLRAAIRRTQRLGYGTNFEESEPGVNAIGVPIVDAHGITRGAIAVTGPSSRFRRERFAAVVAAARRAAGAVAASMPPFHIAELLVRETGNTASARSLAAGTVRAARRR